MKYLGEENYLIVPGKTKYKELKAAGIVGSLFFKGTERELQKYLMGIKKEDGSKPGTTSIIRLANTIVLKNV